MRTHHAARVNLRSSRLAAGDINVDAGFFAAWLQTEEVAPVRPAAPHSRRTRDSSPHRCRGVSSATGTAEAHKVDVPGSGVSLSLPRQDAEGVARSGLPRSGGRLDRGGHREPVKVEVRPTNLCPKEFTMTNATMALAELAEKGADVDVLRQMVQFMAQRLMELDVEARCGAGYDEKTPERLNSRNGYRQRALDTRAGSVELTIPRLRQGSYFYCSHSAVRCGSLSTAHLSLSGLWTYTMRWDTTRTSC